MLEEKVQSLTGDIQLLPSANEVEELRNDMLNSKQQINSLTQALQEKDNDMNEVSGRFKRAKEDSNMLRDEMNTRLVVML